MKKHDIILISIIAIILIGGFVGFKLYQNAHANEPLIAEITQNNLLVERIDLSAVKEARVIKLPGDYEEYVLIEKGRIRFKEAECPDQVCVNTGWLKEPGDIAVCLPNKAIIVIREGK
ncbi:NusG domain II-containing protein [Dehalobacter sp. DCM]|uniref:NusG domain II-containing protein n=1 Tax=Dehalobacter sp. DCM TaxID=2907827 RepID=UPI0030821E16|nr:NusG domain II-containing protein [Dehalobacter sp. DCM]